MQFKLDWKWEKLDETTYRSKVIGGWLLLHTNSIAITDGKKREAAQSESMVFIADRDHQWFIKPPVKDEQAVKDDIAKDF